jgi:hypothetical protein
MQYSLFAFKSKEDIPLSLAVILNATRFLLARFYQEETILFMFAPDAI